MENQLSFRPPLSHDQAGFAQCRADVFKALRRDREKLKESLAQLDGPPISIANYVDHAARPLGNFTLVNGYVKGINTRLPKAIDLPGCGCPPGLCPLPECSCFAGATWIKQDDADGNDSVVETRFSLHSSNFATEHAPEEEPESDHVIVAGSRRNLRRRAKAVAATQLSSSPVEYPAQLAYDGDGRAKDDVLQHSRKVFECNRLCNCGDACVNKVVSRGRKVPLELFKTEKCGWGVRAVSDIPKGTFLATYNGEILHTDEAEERGPDYDDNNQTYLYDLDAFGTEEHFCIDAMHYGDISRFFCHSCDPNVVCLAVVRANQREIYQHAFFTKCDVAAGDELCFDYDTDYHSKEGKSRGQCYCGSDNCRGWMFKIEKASTSVNGKTSARLNRIALPS